MKNVVKGYLMASNLCTRVTKPLVKFGTRLGYSSVICWSALGYRGDETSRRRVQWGALPSWSTAATPLTWQTG